MDDIFQKEYAEYLETTLKELVTLPVEGICILAKLQGGATYTSFHKSSITDKMKERFPDVDWWCDRCGAYLNTQNGFDDHHYIWRCTECGHKNSISADNIYESHEDYHNHQNK